MSTRIPVTVLGATRVVGQRFVRRLADHPLFEVRHLAASPQNVGRRYCEACSWRLPGEPFAGFSGQYLDPCDPDKNHTPVREAWSSVTLPRSACALVLLRLSG